MLTASLWILGAIVGVSAYLNIGYQWGLAQQKLWRERHGDRMLALLSFPVHFFLKKVGGPCDNCETCLGHALPFSAITNVSYPWVTGLIWPLMLLWGVVVGVIPYLVSRGFVTGPRFLAAKIRTAVVAYRAGCRERRSLAKKSSSRLEVLTAERGRLLAERGKLDECLDKIDGELASLTHPFRDAPPALVEYPDPGQ